MSPSAWAALRTRRSDRAVWFTPSAFRPRNTIGRIRADGTVKEFQIPTADARPAGITAGPDGNIWFTEWNGNKIGRITPSGEVTEFAIPTPKSRPSSLTIGPDGNVWFVENVGRIGRLAFPGGLGPPATNVPTLSLVSLIAIGTLVAVSGFAMIGVRGR
jgi:virginiamycin B lyase